MGELIHTLSDEQLQELAQEALQGGEELETALTLIRREIGYRGLVLAVPDTTGAIDALADSDGMVNPPEPMNLWADWAQPKPTPEWERAPLPPSPKYLHSPLNYPPVDV